MRKLLSDVKYDCPLYSSHFDYLYTAHTYHQCDDFILPSPRSSVFSFLRKMFSWTRLRSEAAVADATSAELRSYSIQLYLDRMTNRLVGFVTGMEGHGDQLISHIALACRQVNDHLVIAHEGRNKKGPATFGQIDVQKVMYYMHRCSNLP